MQTSPCTRCGAEIPLEARFCRSCGQPSARFNRESVTEGTTRLLETPERPAASPAHEFQHERQGELAQATNRLPPQAAQTNRGLEVNAKPTNWVLVGAIVVAAIALIVTGILIGLRGPSPAPATQPIVVTPGVPAGLPPAPPPGIPPPPPAAGVTEGAINPALIYPGAKTVMQITGGDEGNVIQLQTSDSFDKVVNWYKEKLKPEQTIEQNMGLPGRSVVLPGKETTAIITQQGDATGIMLTQGDH